MLGASATSFESLQPSERAALSLRSARGSVRSTGAAESIIFNIPLVGRHHVSDWSSVLARLNLTLTSFLEQTNSNWHAVICGQDAPDLPDDPRITFLPFDTPVEGNDKWSKLRVLSEHLPNTGPRAGLSACCYRPTLAIWQEPKWLP